MCPLKTVPLIRGFPKNGKKNPRKRPIINRNLKKTESGDFEKDGSS